MKKINYVIGAVMLFSASMAKAEDVLQVIPFETTAGVVEDDFESFTVEMTNTAAYTALQFDLYLPEGLTLIESEAMELSPDRFPGTVNKRTGVFSPEHNYDCTKKSDTHYLITLYHNDFATIEGTEGDLLYFYYETSEDMADGYYPITVSGTVLTIDSHHDVKPATSTSYVQIGKPETSIDTSILSGYIPSFVTEQIPTDAAAYDFSNVDELGETFTPTNPNAIQYVKAGSAYAGTVSERDNVVVVDGDNLTCSQLTLADGHTFDIPKAFVATKASYQRTADREWGTVCLPFATRSNDKVQYYQLEEKTGSTLVFSPVEEVEAGVPCVFQRLADETEMMLTAEQVAVGIDLTEAPTATGLTLLGTYEQQRVDVDEAAPSYYLKDNAFCRGNDYFIVPAFRAYFKSEGVNEVKAYSVLVKDDATGVRTVVGVLPLDGSDIYTPSGVKVGASVPHGIYIKNGKKYFSK